MDSKITRNMGQTLSKVKRSHDEMTDSTRVSRSSGGKERVKAPKTANEATAYHEHRSSRPTSNLDAYTTLGRLSYAPATQTTVVTTTTTTTTSFPPLVMNPPRPLYTRDPKQYPLAMTPTPSSLRSIEVNINGIPAHFEEETEDSLQVLAEMAQHQARLDASNGTLQSISHSEPSYEVSENMQRQLTQDVRPQTSSRLGRHKRNMTPPSLAEAAEIAYQRRSKKMGRSLRSSDSSGLQSRLLQATDESDAANSALGSSDTKVFKAPAPGSRLKRPSLRTHSKNMSASSLEQEPQLPNTVSRSSLSRHLGASRSTSSSTVAGVAATPPIVEGDLERAPPYEDNDRDGAQQRLASIDTSAAQDAPLPSPSLSPITAAANLISQHQHNQEEEEDENEVSSLDISQDTLDGYASSHIHNRRMSDQLQKLEMPPPLQAGSSNPPLPTPTFMDMPTMLDSFDGLPSEMQRWVMYQMLRRCSKDTLHFVADVVNPALKCDFLALLPLELSLQVTKYLDAKSMCRAAQVSRKWRQILDSDEAAWKDLLNQDGFKLSNGELERAIREGWGWQSPYGLDSGEEDLSYLSYSSGSEWGALTKSPVSVSSFQGENEVVATSSGRPKRKASSRNGPSNKRQKRKGPSSSGKQQLPLPINAFDDAQGPIAHASAAAAAVPNTEVGLPSLRNLHLYKSLYRRHFLIGKSWMQEDMKPRHIAFRAHQRHVVTCLQFDADKILTGSDDTKINVYDTKTGAKRKTLEGHEGGVWALEYDGNTLVSGSTDRSVRVWDIETGKCLQVFQGHTSTVRCLVILKPTQIDTHDDGTPIMAPKQPLIITGSRDSSLRVWKLPKPGERSVFQAGPPANDFENPYFVRALTGHHHSVRAIAAHGDTLVSGSYDCTVRVWKISTGEMQHRLSGHTQKVYSVVLDHARKRCISGSMDNLVKVWSLEQGICLFNLEGHTSLVGLLDLSHERLVSAAADSTLRIWDPDNGQCKAKLTAHTGAITCFQHDDQKVISGSDKLLKMWNIKTGDCTKDLLTNLSGVWQVKFNDRRCVAAVQRNNLTYIEVLDFGASRDGVPRDRRGTRIVVDKRGNEIAPEELEDTDDSLTT